jgi:hypothetical protein
MEEECESTVGKTLTRTYYSVESCDISGSPRVTCCTIGISMVLEIPEVQVMREA